MMLNDQRCTSTECSPKTLAKKIESCIVRNALDEEQRAQKALYLLKTRDRRIAFLEKRVAELQNLADNIHELHLRKSSSILNPERDKEAASDFRSERSLKIDDETEKSDSNFSNTENLSKTLDEDCDTVSGSRITIPRLKLSKSSLSNSEKDIFSTATNFLVEERKCSASSICVSDKDQSFERAVLRKDKSTKEIKDSKRETKVGGLNEQEKIDGVEKLLSEEKKSDSVMFIKNIEGKLRKRCSFPRTSASVPWIRAKHSFRRKLRNLELRSGKRVEKLPVGDGHATRATYRKIETVSTNRRQPGEEGIVDGVKKVERNTVAHEQDGQGTHLIADERMNTNTKIASTQTSIDFAQTNEKNLQITEAISNVYRSSSCVCFERKKSTEFRGVDEEPAPQWLIEEALNRGSRSERWTKGKISSSKEIEYQKIVSELEAQLTQTKEDLEEALQSKSLVKEKYKRSLENIKMKAREESEMLQEKIVLICTSVLEKFGPNVMVDKRKNSYRVKCRGRLKYHEKISSKLHRKLRMAVVRSNKLKRELTAARKALKNKSEMYESISKCFDELKRDMDTTEMNLNNLISENLSLRKKIDDTRDWLAERNVEKEHHASNHFRDAHKNRELSNLKKKVEEDKATIGQLRNRLMRSESANTNKGFLLNSYKSQLIDLNKEKDRLVSKINSLENEISAVRNNNSQLKAKISILNNEKDKLHSDNKKSKTDITEKIETQCAKKCEQTIQQETEIIKAKYDETIRSMKMKITAISNQNSEYSKAIKEFLRKIHNQGKYESQRNSNENESEASEREAHETACNILNMTPEELSGFINGKTSNSINPWILELNRILAENHFSGNLSKFLFRKCVHSFGVSLTVRRYYDYYAPRTTASRFTPASYLHTVLLSPAKTRSPLYLRA